MFALAFWASAVTSQAASRPNIVFFLVDDLGWSDLACYGSKFHATPHIDRLAKNGLRFTQGYAACSVCSPTRASILTGRYPARLGITDFIPGMRATSAMKPRFKHIEDRDNLDLREVTLAEYLKSEGNYQTHFLGKWHLGKEGHWPTDQGFDENIGGNEKGSPPGGYYGPWNNPTLKAKNQGEYLTTRLTDEAIRIISDSKSSQPFLLYFSYYNVHTPIQADIRSIEKFRSIAATQFTGPTPLIKHRGSLSRGRQDNPEFASMVSAVDTSVGRVIDALEQSGMTEETIIIFFSDNGGLCTRPDSGKSKVGPTSNLPLRSGKGWLYEGGIREPLIIRVPGMTNPGTQCDTPVISMDFFPTIIELAGLPLAPKLHVDGISLVPLLKGEPLHQARSLYWHYPHYHGSGWRPGAAIRENDWKLIEFYESDETELYDLSNDSAERNDLSTQFPDETIRLKAKLSEWQSSIGAAMPEERPKPDI